MESIGGTASPDASSFAVERLIVDEMDHRLITALRADPRAANRALAAELSVSEPTIAARLRGLMERDAIHPTVQVNTAALGDDLFTFVEIFVRDRDIEEVAAEICKIEKVTAVSLALGDPSIIIHVNTRDRLELIDGPLKKISEVRGVIRIESDIVLKVIKYFPEFTIAPE